MLITLVVKLDQLCKYSSYILHEEFEHASLHVNSIKNYEMMLVLISSLYINKPFL